MSVEPTSCPACGAKFRQGLRRCPRCRARMDVSGSVPRGPQSGRLALLAAAASVALLCALWFTRSGEAPMAAPAAADTRVAAPAAIEPQPVEPDAVPRAERAFLDAPASASLAYASGDMEAARRHYESAIARNPDDAESLSNLGQVLVRLDRAAEALPYFERAIALVPDRWAYRFNLARALGVLERWPEAVASYRIAQELFPDDYVTAFNLGLALRKVGDDEEAAAAFQKAIAIDPNEPSFRMALGMAYERMERSAEAAAAYEEALRLSPEAPDADVVRRRIEQLRGAPVSAPAPAPAPGVRSGSSS